MIKSNKIWQGAVFFGLAVLMLVLWSPNVEASIVIEGDKEFKDEIEECISAYRNTEGIVGDVIKELENSENTHKISESPAWVNSPEDGAKARDGKGTGTHTQVSGERLEELKERIDALKNKDFCTALLHEMWHAVDADRGEWSDEKTEGVWDDEIEATMFQNFIHAIRGVDPRTSYGGVDLSSYLGLSDDVLEEEEFVGTIPDAVEIAISSIMSFEHVVPGEYSEVYMDITGEPGSQVSMTLSGPAVEQTNASGTLEANGKLRLTWKIYLYGEYTASGKIVGQTVEKTVNVQ